MSLIIGRNYIIDNRPITTEGNRSSLNAVFPDWLVLRALGSWMSLPLTELAFHPISILITSANGQDVGYIFVGSCAKFFWGSVLMLSGMYLP